MQEDDFEYVGFWLRVVAALIDSVIVSIIITPALIAVYGMGYYLNTGRPLIAGPADVLISWVLPALAVILFWLFRRATPGKMVISAQVVDARTGKSLTTGQAIGRYFAYFVATLPFCLGLIWVAFDPRKQGRHGDDQAQTARSAALITAGWRGNVARLARPYKRRSTGRFRGR